MIIMLKIKNKRTKEALFFLLIILLSFLYADESSETKALRPDIILILVDDLGFSDLGCYGSEIETPNLDYLASKGLRFSQFYNASKCEPSRTTIMTGHYWPDVGLGAKKGATIGEVFQSARYKTLAVGKWHLSGHPMDRGFDDFFGHLSGASSYFPPLNKSFMIGRESFRAAKADKDFYLTDKLTDFTIDWIKRHKKNYPRVPYFTYLAYNAPHNPLQAPRENIEKYRGKYIHGWDYFRKRRYDKMLNLKIISDKTKLSIKPSNIPDWDSLNNAQKDLEDLRMSTYAAMIDRLDQNLGNLINSLKDAKLDNNLLILFMSDNGASPFARTDSHMLRIGKLPGDRESNWEIGMAWANVSNTPFRLYKRNQHEGGISTPMIAWWPEQINKPGTIVHQTAHLIDIMPTFIELSGAHYPSKSGASLPKLPGKSLVPIFKGKKHVPHKYLYFQLFDHRAISSNEWKLTAVEGKEWELYNVQNDRSETKNLIERHPKIAKDLSERWEKWWLESTGIHYSPSKNPTPSEYLRDDRGDGQAYEPSPMPRGFFTF